MMKAIFAVGLFGVTVVVVRAAVHAAPGLETLACAIVALGLVAIVQPFFRGE